MYLAQKLAQGPRPIPSFGHTGFRELSRHSEKAVGQTFPWMGDQLAGAETEQIARIYRVITELEVAQAIIRGVMEKKQEQEGLAMLK